MDGESTPDEVQSGPSPGMMLKAKLAPHLLHDHEWDGLASQMQPKRLFDGGSAGAGTPSSTPMRSALTAVDAPVDPQYQQPTSAGQQKSIMEERAARLDPNKTKRPVYNPMNPDGSAKMTRGGTPVGGAPAPAAPTTPAAPRREASNPLTGDQGQANRTRSGPVAGGAIGGGPSFTNPTSKGIYDSHVRTLFSQPTAPSTPLRRGSAPVLD